MKQTNVHKLAACAMIAAFYAAVSLSLPMLSYGVVQMRWGFSQCSRRWRSRG